ncbi:MAG: SapC family protein [Sphingopyxis sp.]|jgi:hypothetical protein|uniref:SapC family protein n=1 Tax=Sphingopyxis sp. TaxID=1908224 RepID=UPI001A3AD83B|nr:SapC family protein [Sphingopyxis sp.]MBL9071004.1 SapC family protein [Sphingopyxis sp.]
MATAPANNLPLFYNDLIPLSSVDHANFHARPLDSAEFLVNQHAVPLTSDEFVSACRFFPIIFSAGDNPVPLALMGLNEGVNTFVDTEGKLLNPVYVPAYIRRYPFLLARLNPGSEELSLCFDPTSGAIGEFEEGDALFADGKPTDPVNAVLEFCKNFEEAGQRTSLFVEELKKADLLMDGEVAIQPEGSEKPYIYRGFQMVDENKLRELRGDVLRKMMQNGILGLIFAHLFSLQLMRDVFAEQVRAGKVPEILELPTAAV